MRILVVEDEPLLREGLTDLLKNAGHGVDVVSDGASAISYGISSSYDLVLLDLMLPKVNGMEVCRKLREAKPGLPIIMLTARGSEDDKVEGLGSGADDYITKPFSPRELLARVDAVSRRVSRLPSEAEDLECDHCRFELGRCIARRGRMEISLTPREVGIIRWLHRHKARAVTRQELLEQVWGANSAMETRTVDMTIANLRQKIERDPARPIIIVTVTGRGYAWGAK